MTKADDLGLGRIDVQFHFCPDFYVDMVRETSHIWTDRWGTQAALDYMDANGVAAGVLSVSTPGVDFVSSAESVKLARRLNEAAAEVVRQHPTRFGNFATLPLQDVDATLEEIAYCFDTLGVDGVCMMSNVRGRYLGHESLAPVFDELNRRGTVLFVHPTDPVGMADLTMAPVAEWPYDTARAAIDLVYSGTVRRCPDLRVILAHAGGALPMVWNRVVSMAAGYSTADPQVLRVEAEEQIARYYYDLAISARPNVIAALREVSDLEHVLFACDWLFAPDAAVTFNIDGYEQLDLTGAERTAIDRGNAASLFPRLFAH